MKTKYICILGVILSLLDFSSCDKSLDNPQQGVTTASDFYKTDEDAVQAIAAVYSAWRGLAFNNFFLKNVLSDDVIAGGGSRGDNTFMEQLNEYTFGPGNTIISGTFSGYYSVIYLSNLVITNFKAEESDVKARVIAEAKVARAWCYFNLVTLWGPVPFVLTPLSPSEYQQPNGNVTAIWAQIEKDLKEALESNALPEKKDANDKTPGARLTKQAALAFLGKSQVFEGKYAEAAATLKQVINSGKYALYDDYGNILRSVNDFGSENIFELNVLKDPANAFNQGATLFGPMIGWRMDHMNSAGYWVGAHDMYPNGWGFANPTKDLYNAFENMEGAEGYRLNNTIKTYEQVAAMTITINPGANLYGNQGYFDWKFRFLGSEVIPNSYGLATNTNFRVMRYAEVLLLAAEACVQSNDAPNALDYVNQIRIRAQLSPLSAVTMDDIKKEKRLELCFEQCRFQDLIRWGDAATVLSDKGKEIPSFFGLKTDGTYDTRITYTNSKYGFKAGQHELLPFPELEMTSNKNLKQNPKW